MNVIRTAICDVLIIEPEVFGDPRDAAAPTLAAAKGLPVYRPG
jgi:hypothetical protein